MADAAERARGLGGLRDPAAVEQVVVIGMGGSGMAGDVVAAVAAPMLAVPVLVVKSYECPAFVGPGSLVFAVSASGNTEETLQAAADAAAAGATMVVITGGGKLAELAGVVERPGHRRPGDHPPASQPGSGPWRSRRWSCWTRWACTAAAGTGSTPPSTSSSAGATSWPAPATPARPPPMARRIGRTFPLIHGGGAIGAAAAQRWKTQVNENAKAPAFWSAQPELCHNEVCGWGQHGDVTRQVVTAVALRHDAEHPQVGRRFDLVGELLREVVADVIEVRAEGEGDLAQLLDLILFGDYVSLWMAVEAGIDPGPVPILVELKARLDTP